MYFPLQLRLTLFYALVLALALWFFGHVVYTQAAQRAYSDLDNTLRSRAASVEFGKDIITPSTNLPLILPSVNNLGTDGVAIEVFDNSKRLIATTTSSPSAGTTVDSLGNSPIPWDARATQWIMQHPLSQEGLPNSIYSTITYQGQQVRVYTTANTAFGTDYHIIQTARSEQDIEQSLSDLQLLLLRGGILVMLLALLGGWLITRGILARVRQMIRTAQSISASRNFSRRVPDKAWMGRDELSLLASTFNDMLGNLEESYQRQQRFVADASHELRAPITSIRCNLDLLAKAPDLPDEEAQAALNDAQAEAGRMGRLVNDLLTLARSDEITTKQPIFHGYTKSSEKLHVVDLDSLLLEVFRQYRPVEENESDEQRGPPRVTATRVDAINQVPTIHEDDGEKWMHQGPRLMLQDITPARVYGDADQLKQAMVALLDNALKYTPYEGTVSLSLTTSRGYALVTVSDTGIGIFSEDLPHIFERFYRADRARSRERGGSGLGLAIVESIAQEHKGSIEVESTPGKGSTFRLKLPLILEVDR